MIVMNKKVSKAKIKGYRQEDFVGAFQTKEEMREFTRFLEDYDPARRGKTYFFLTKKAFGSTTTGIIEMDIPTDLPLQDAWIDYVPDVETAAQTKSTRMYRKYSLSEIEKIKAKQTFRQQPWNWEILIDMTKISPDNPSPKVEEVKKRILEKLKKVKESLKRLREE